MNDLNGVPGQKILLVDDEEQMREILREALMLMGHQVDTARDGRKAMDKVDNNTFDIVITDIHMPNMDGMQLIHHLREQHSDVDVIAITGHSMDYTYTDVVNGGASDFIIKPFTLNELEAKLKRIIRERILRKELEHLAVQDPLTGLYNRRFFEDALRKEVVRATRYGYPLLLFFIDIDRFKSFNDQKGHRAGDQVLRQFAGVLRQCIRKEVDIASRYGGDEFVLVLPHLMPDQALLIADRIRERYNELDFQPTHLSIGIAQLKVGGGSVEKDMEVLIHSADEALYYAKGPLGGDCAFIYKTEPEEASA